MQNGIIYDLSAGNGVERTMKFKEQSLPIKSAPKDIQQDQRKPEELTIKELRHQIRAYKVLILMLINLKWKCTNVLQFRWQVLYLLL